MAKPDIWNDELLASLPGATQDLIALEVDKTLQDFCRKSGAWIVESNPVNVRAGVDTYNFSRINQGFANILMTVTIDKRPIRVYENRPKAPSYFGTFAYSPKPGFVTLVPTPDKDIDEGLEVVFSYITANKATYIDDLFETHWYNYILSGVMSRMMAMPGKPFSNASLATYHGSMYRAGIAEARDVARRRFSTAESEWAFPRWA